MSVCFRSGPTETMVTGTPVSCPCAITLLLLCQAPVVKTTNVSILARNIFLNTAYIFISLSFVEVLHFLQYGLFRINSKINNPKYCTLSCVLRCRSFPTNAHRKHYVNGIFWRFVPVWGNNRNKIPLVQYNFRRIWSDHKSRVFANAKTLLLISRQQFLFMAN